MAEDLRNPYIILGLDFGATKEEARHAFARASRRVKRKSDSRYTIEDVTWALHQVEQMHNDPNAEVTIFRVPANPSLFDASFDDGLFAAPPEPLERRTGPPSEDEIAELTIRALREVVAKVLGSLGPFPVVEAAYESAGREA
jgi:hypothetical protein